MNRGLNNTVRRPKLLGLVLIATFSINILWTTSSIAIECMYYSYTQQRFVQKTTRECSKKSIESRKKAKKVLPDGTEDPAVSGHEKVRRAIVTPDEPLKLRRSDDSQERLKQRTRDGVKEEKKTRQMKNKA